jgi:hypothetical protein
MRASDGPRRLAIALSLGLAVGGGSLAGCHRTAAHKAEQSAPNAEPVKQSYAELTKQFADMQQSFSDLSKDLETIPADLPGYARLRTSFYQTEEARGVTNAKVTMLSSRLDAALISGKPEELQQVSNDIAKTSNDGRKLGELYLKLLHQVMAFQRVADQRKEALVAAKTAPSPGKAKGQTKQSTSQH